MSLYSQLSQSTAEGPLARDCTEGGDAIAVSIASAFAASGDDRPATYVALDTESSTGGPPVCFYRPASALHRSTSVNVVNVSTASTPAPGGEEHQNTGIIAVNNTLYRFDAKKGVAIVTLTAGV